jgi:hypothetical protein
MVLSLLAAQHFERLHAVHGPDQRIDDASLRKGAPHHLRIAIVIVDKEYRDFPALHLSGRLF